MTLMRQLLVAGLLLVATHAWPLTETFQFSSPELEVRYQLLSEELRCPKCQNQTIADSNALIAEDLRQLLYQQLEQGASNDEILDYMVARYGEFVRYRPRFSGVTAILWVAPFLLLLAGGVAVILALRSRPGQHTDTSAHLSAAEQARVDALLDETGKDS